MNPKNIQHIWTYCQANKANMTRLVEALALSESPSTVAASQQAVLEILEAEWQALGYEVIRLPGQATGGHLFARPKDRVKDQPRQLMVGHCDTVWPLGTLDTMPLKVTEHTIHGPGVYDMKAGLVQMLFAIKCLDSLGLKPRVLPLVFVNSDEEIGSHESGRHIHRLARISDRAFILEPGLELTGKLKTARKGIGRFTIEVKGRSAHAGLDPGKGASAIVELSFLIQQLFAMNDLEKGISVNVGMIDGGVRANVVAAESRAVIDVRVHSHEDAEQLTKQIMALSPQNPEVTLNISGGMGRPPMEPTPRNRQLWRRAQQAAELLEIPLEEGTAGGGSDGNTTSLYTATLDGLGPAGDGAHAVHEFAFIDKLAERTALLALLLMGKPMNEPE